MPFQEIVAPSIRELFVQQLTGLILSGELRPGDRLPTERELADEMKISKTVVHEGKMCIRDRPSGSAHFLRLSGNDYALFQSATCPRSHSHHASTPSPVLAEMGKISSFGLRMRAYSTTFSMSKSKYGRTSILLMMSASQTVKISGYFSGLSCPSGTERIIAFFTLSLIHI